MAKWGINRVDPDRNAEVFADLLSLVDAIPFEAMHRRSDRGRPEPPTWAELTGTAKTPK